ncbi:MAG: hypothetical protein ACTSVI_08640, partial [Promethearchaeota archaeon]
MVYQIYIFNDEKNDFEEISGISSEDVVFIIISEEKKIIIWHGKESRRMAQYKAGMKVSSLISSRQLYGYKYDIIKEGEEYPLLQTFIKSRYGKRYKTPEEIAKEDRKLVKEKVQAISSRYTREKEKINETEIGSPPSMPKKQESSLKELTTPVTSRIEQGHHEELHEEKDEKEKVEEKGKEQVIVDDDKIKEEIRSMTKNLGAEMGKRNLDLEKKHFLSKEEREIMDEVRKESMRSDNLINIEEVRLLNEEKKKKIEEEEMRRVARLEEEKKRVEVLERERVEKEKKFLQEKLRKEKEIMRSEREELKRRLEEERIKRQKELEELDKKRKQQQEDVVNFELKKIELRMQVRKKGVDYLEDVPAGAKVLYHINQDFAEKCDDYNLTSEDVYLLDIHDAIHVWFGKYSSIEERFFGSEIAKLIKLKRNNELAIHELEQDRESDDFITLFNDLWIINGSRKDVLRDFKNRTSINKIYTFLVEIKKDSLIFRERGANNDTIKSDGIFLIEKGKDFLLWFGRDLPPEILMKDEALKEKIEKLFDIKLNFNIVKEGREPRYQDLSHEFWEIIVGLEKAYDMREKHEEEVMAVKRKLEEEERKRKQEKELKRLEEEKRALNEIERIERELLQKEIERRKNELTPEDIEDLWKNFRNKMRKRRGLPEEEPETTKEKTQEDKEKTTSETSSSTPKILTIEEKRKIKEQKLKELEQLKRIELEMLEKRIMRAKPSFEEEARWRKDLDEKIAKKREK